MLCRTTIVALLGLCSAAGAQNLQPRDFTPTEDIALRVVSLSDDVFDDAVIVTEIENRTAGVVTASIECSLYSQAGDPIGSAMGTASAVPPESAVVTTITSVVEGAGRAFCRVTRFRSE